MTSVKPRPPNASGPNGLRGGIKQYVPKTITGRWLEEFGGPSGYRRGFTTVEYETEGQHQQTGAKFRPPKEFGPELPDEYSQKPPSSPFKYETKGSEDLWRTTSRDQGASILTRDRKKEEETALTPHLDRETLENYRKTWCSDPEFQRHRRFVTETRLSSGNVGSQFNTPTVRPLPGTPKSLELCRAQVVEKYGIFAFTMLKAMLGSSGSVSSADFKRALNSLGCNLKPFQLNQIIAYITPGDEIPVEQFLYVLRGTVPPLDHKQVANMAAYDRLLNAIQAHAGGADREISFEDDVVGLVRGDEHPEIVEALRDYAKSVYVTSSSSSSGAHVRLSEIRDMLLDMYAVAPETFAQSLKAIWDL